MEKLEQKTKNIEFILGGENAPFVEQNIEEAPLFKEQYEQLIDRVKFYCERNKANQNSEHLVEQYANILAINGDRGMGKTSVLLSLIEYLKNHPLDNNIPKNAFLTLPLIDPSFFSDGANTLQIIIAQLYKYFKSLLNQISQNDRNEILTHFACVKKCLNLVSSKSLDLIMDEIEDLENLSAAIDLRKHIARLVSSLLKIENKSMLILSIDDIDLNSKYAYEMLEQLRKYFTLPNVLILFAVNIDQLQQVVVQTFERDYGEQFGFVRNIRNIENVENVENVENIQKAKKYLLKLIPLKNRVALHDMEVYSDATYSIVERNGSNKIDVVPTAIMDIPRVLYCKTKYLFLNKENVLTEIVPRNLREFRMFLSILSAMQDIQGNWQERIAVLSANQQRFKEYFYDVWTALHLNIEEQTIVNRLREVSDYTMFNKMVVSILYQKYRIEPLRRVSYFDRREDGLQTPLQFICDPINTNYNISLGDVLALCSYIETTKADESCHMLIFAIKAMYTMHLQDTLQEQISSEELEKYIYSLRMVKSATSSSLESRLKQVYFSNYQLLFGGCAINSAYNAFLPSPINWKRNRLYHECQLDVPKKQNKQRNLFDMLVTLYSWEERKENSTNAYRRRKQAYYKRDLSQVKMVCYDFFAWTYNLPYINECLRKFNTSNDYEPELSTVAISDWLRKNTLTSVDYIDAIVDNLNRTKFEMSNSDPILIYKDIFSQIIRCVQEISDFYLVPKYEAPEFMKKLLESTTSVPLVLKESNKKTTKEIYFRQSELRKIVEITADTLWNYVNKKNPNLPKEVKNSLFEYLHGDVCMDLIHKQDLDSIVKDVKAFRYDVEV